MAVISTRRAGAGAARRSRPRGRSATPPGTGPPRILAMGRPRPDRARRRAGAVPPRGRPPARAWSTITRGGPHGVHVPGGRGDHDRPAQQAVALARAAGGDAGHLERHHVVAEQRHQPAHGTREAQVARRPSACSWGSTCPAPACGRCRAGARPSAAPRCGTPRTRTAAALLAHLQVRREPRPCARAKPAAAFVGGPSASKAASIGRARAERSRAGSASRARRAPEGRCGAGPPSRRGHPASRSMSSAANRAAARSGTSSRTERQAQEGSSSRSDLEQKVTGHGYASSPLAAPAAAEAARRSSSCSHVRARPPAGRRCAPGRCTPCAR